MSSRWQKPFAPPVRLTTSPGDADAVDLWWLSTRSDTDAWGDMELLGADEQARAERFCFERDRMRFIRRHAFVRRVLGSYIGVEPGAVAIEVSPEGRPEVAAGSDISFNSSSADDLCVLAVAQGRRVGVDIERLRELEDAMDIAEGLYGAREARHLRSLPRAARSAAFLALWTRKESLVKALGGGLSIPLDLHDLGGASEDGTWQPAGPSGPMAFVVTQLEAPSGYVGALTAAGSQVSVRHFGPEAIP